MDRREAGIRERVDEPEYEYFLVVLLHLTYS